jgi:hypothetical protein
MFIDFWTMHADVIRNAFVLLTWMAVVMLATVLATRHVYRKKAIKEASEYLKQKNVELRIENRIFKETNGALLTTVERLTKVQNAAMGAANTIHEITSETIGDAL